MFSVLSARWSFYPENSGYKINQFTMLALSYFWPLQSGIYGLNLPVIAVHKPNHVARSLPEQELDVKLFTMKNALFLICALALFATGFVSAAHAHVDVQGSDQQIGFSIDQDNTDSNAADPMCDMHCAHHHHLAFSGSSQSVCAEISATQFSMDSDNINSAPVYGLKRPPRS